MKQTCGGMAITRNLTSVKGGMMGRQVQGEGGGKVWYRVRSMNGGGGRFKVRAEGGARAGIRSEVEVRSGEGGKQNQLQGQMKGLGQGWVCVNWLGRVKGQVSG